MPTFDLSLLLCERCRHVQLLDQVSPTLLYGDQYSFESSQSDSTRRGTTQFLSFLDRMFPGRQFRCILDVGCNDLYMLKQLRERAETRIGIDPIWAWREPDTEDPGIRLIGGLVEDLDLPRVLGCRPDLILCRHTLEHVSDPRGILEQLLAVASDDAHFLIEVPGFEHLLSRMRFDQIFHQHLQYFSLLSLCELLETVEAQYVRHDVNYRHWGALLVLFKKRGGSDGGPEGRPAPISRETVARQKEIFLDHMSVVRESIDSLGGEALYGYGASPMLPALAYHLQSDLSFLRSVLDDDSGKDGLYYQNLPLRITGPDSISLSDSTILITAVDSAMAILRQLAEHPPKHLIVPLPIL